MAINDYRGTNYNRGIRNNNPGNLRPGDNWQGMAGVSDNFIVFKDVFYGCRALATDISNKYFSGLDSVTKIINKYAPPMENNTIAYINAVSNAIGVSPTAKIDLTKDMLFKFMRAVIMHENGSQGSMITDAQILTGISMMQPSLLLKVKGF
jgi:hypothetical protein